MPRRPRLATADRVFHVMNRAVQNLELFENSNGYEAFFRVMGESIALIPMRILAYVLMPTHWHLILWPLHDESLASFMKGLTASHAQLWRQRSGTRGRGAVYQGRYKAIAIQSDSHLLRVCRYVERNPLRAKLVAYAEAWPWSSASSTASGPNRPLITPWPVPRPANWSDYLNAPESPHDLAALRSAIRSGRHFGSPSWRLSAQQQLRWRSGSRGPGRCWSSVDMDADTGEASSEITIL